MLSLMISVPLLGAFLLTVMKFNERGMLLKIIPILSSVITLIINIILLYRFDATKLGFSFVDKWLGIEIGVDNISLLLLLLTTFLFPLCIIISLEQIKEKNIQSLMALFLLLEGLTIGVFVALDIIMFYVFFEAVLIPMFFIIGIWGHKSRVYASFKLFLYTLVGSLLFLIAVIYMYVYSGGISSMEKLTPIISQLSLTKQYWLWLGCFAAFAVKLPMVPLHTWLPNAHVQAPTGGSIILAGILIKIGGYGFLRLSLPMFPDASLYFANFVIMLSIIAVIYGSIVAFAQTNIKKLIAYSSIAHMGFVTAGIFSFNEYGISGAVFQMLSHGIISAALFLCAGILYHREHTFNIEHYSGLVKVMPMFSTIFIILSMASIGVPGTSGFIGEFLTIMSMFHSNRLIAAGFIASGIVISAIYILFLCKRIIWGITPESLMIRDVNKTEFFILIILVIFVILLGVHPGMILSSYLKPAVSKLLVNSFHFII